MLPAAKLKAELTGRIGDLRNNLVIYYCDGGLRNRTLFWKVFDFHLEKKKDPG